ncbi:MAG: DUF3857 domain-containing protein [Ferruginibacter sp.]
MKTSLHFLLTTCILFLSISVFSQSNKPTVAKEPAWITKNVIDYNATSLDKHATDGYMDISYEKQVNLAEQSRYYRLSKKIVSQAGIQNGSEISIPFDPTYEKLSFHSIHIIRKGEILDRLQLSKIKILHQEEELTNFIYNGNLNAVLILEDVRKGDIIEYSYTRKGFNPIFKNKYTDVYNTEFSFPEYQIYFKLIVPQGRAMNIKNLNETLQPVISTLNGQQVYEWKKNNVMPLALQDYSPSWYDPYAQIQISEYNSWKEVNDWAMELFPAKKTFSPELQKKITEIKNSFSGDADRTKAALQFVQDDIRYMGIEIGENSHKPADLSKVMAQRFGDCKEKSYLLCCMLNAMNIEASPVLINTDSKKSIHNFLPASTDFDHVTVRVKLDDVYYWFDPTIAYQRGDIKNIFYPDYQAGLVIAENTSSLTSIDFRNINNVDITEYFKVTSMSGTGSLLVTSVFQGAAADDIRNEFNNSSITELMTGDKKFYTVYYDDIIADSLTYTDNDSTGIFTTTEYYSIPNFWTIDKNKGTKFSISPFMINSIVVRPKEKDRKMPFTLTYPVKYKEDIVVDLPQDWKVTDDETHLKNNSFTYDSKFFCNYNHVHLQTRYENFKDHVSVEDSKEYFRDINKYDDIGSFELSLGNDTITSNNSSHSSNKNIFVPILIVGLIVGGAVWRSQKGRK